MDLYTVADETLCGPPYREFWGQHPRIVKPKQTKTKTNSTSFSPSTLSSNTEMFNLGMNKASLQGGKHVQAFTTIPHTIQDPTYKPSYHSRFMTWHTLRAACAEKVKQSQC